MSISRRGALRLVMAGVAASPLARSQEVAVPLDLQVELLAKVAAYDRNFAARAGAEARVVIVRRPSVADSERVASHVHAALRALSAIDGLPPVPSLLDWVDANAVRDAVKARRAAIVYFAPGLGDDMASIAKALDGADVLSAAASPAYVQKGAVLGFDLVSGKPKLLVNLGAARRQNVAFKAELLKIAKVIE